MFEIIIYILLILSLIYGFYFLIMASGVFRKKKCEIYNNKKNHFAILIAARNEETVIKNLINSLKKQNYPSNKYDVYVIVNNCTDNTLEVAKNAGAKIIECKQKVKSKGEVLKYTFNKLKRKIISFKPLINSVVFLYITKINYLLIYCLKK